jgi:hypothetical protein
MGMCKRNIQRVKIDINVKVIEQMSDFIYSENITSEEK